MMARTRATPERGCGRLVGHVAVPQLALGAFMGPGHAATGRAATGRDATGNAATGHAATGRGANRGEHRPWFTVATVATGATSA